MAAPEQPRWLDDDQQKVWRTYVAMVRQLNEALERQLHRDSDLSLGDYVLLMRLSEAPDRRLRMSELAADTVSSRSRLSHAVQRLEHLGWVRRAACDQDRRGTFAELTDEGFAVLAAAAPGHATAVHDLMFEPLGIGGARTFGELLDRIRDHLDDDAAT
jgi:DNA-binding MarR family transcriptional regulator